MWPASWTEARWSPPAFGTELMSLLSKSAVPPPSMPPKIGLDTLLVRNSLGGIFCTVHAKCGFSADSTTWISVFANSLSHQSRWQWNVCWPDHTERTWSMNVCFHVSDSPGCQVRSAAEARGYWIHQLFVKLKLQRTVIFRLLFAYCAANRPMPVLGWCGSFVKVWPWNVRRSRWESW